MESSQMLNITIIMDNWIIKSQWEFVPPDKFKDKEKLDINK